MLREDFALWRESPVGRWFFDELLMQEIREVQNRLSDGFAAADDVGPTAMRYANLCGIVGGLHHVRNLDPFKEQDETESNGTPPAG